MQRHDNITGAFAEFGKLMVQQKKVKIVHHPMEQSNDIICRKC